MRSERSSVSKWCHRISQTLDSALLSSSNNSTGTCICTDVSRATRTSIRHAAHCPHKRASSCKAPQPFLPPGAGTDSTSPTKETKALSRGFLQAYTPLRLSLTMITHTQARAQERNVQFTAACLDHPNPPPIGWASCSPCFGARIQTHQTN